MVEIEDSHSRVQLMVLNAETEQPCEGEHAYKGTDQCDRSHCESVLYCFHGHDTEIHRFINVLQLGGYIDPSEALQNRSELSAVTHELALKDAAAEALGADGAEDDEIAPAKAKMVDEQLACVRKKLVIIQKLVGMEEQRASEGFIVSF